jgi:hypothetical protein
MSSFTKQWVDIHNARVAGNTKTAEYLKDVEDALNERDLQDQVARFLRIENVYFLQQPFGKKTTATPGTPDFLICYRELFIACECKVGANDLTTEQEIEQARIKKSGGVYLVCRSLIDLKEALRKIDARFDVVTP